ncbi:hypothetical protein F4813DRAFT_400838 [Daldinia decipiens]|uniref:uncharacterized protein n=1 Tax=Daldinia decipiens TaxID=326647 RepID=UPI0020C37B44|nr:uncharacterized protein F4813DRAFT_400838 [Daldinia decipiens]KAI1652761.1 hypothetical protein F4813DRAFT_400838 [Daldinia decipiens]
MNQISTLQREIYGVHEMISERTSRQRSESLPSLRRRVKALEEEHGYDRRRSSCTFLKDKVKRLPELIIARCHYRSAKNEDYDSDEEDERNGVPTVHTQHRGGQFTSDMRTVVAERHEELIDRKCELQGELYAAKQRYLDARDWFINTSSNSQLDAKKCFRYRELEEKYVGLTRKYFKLEDDINELQAMLLSFGESASAPVTVPVTVPAPVQKSGQWDMNMRRSRIWTLANASYEWGSPDDLSTKGLRGKIGASRTF